jgi:hypothetical protein
MSDPEGTATVYDYTDQLSSIANSLLILANYITLLESGNGGITGSFQRAMTVNALKNSGQLPNVINEMNHPTALP